MHRYSMIQQIHDDALAKAAGQHLSGRLIDIGCGGKPYKNLLSEIVSEHVGLDHVGTSHRKTEVDVLGSALEIPYAADSFDCAICTAVIEHVEDPGLALKECHRVLRPGGIAIYTAPFIWPLHETPRDFFRFSEYGLRHLFSAVGFEVVAMNGLAGFGVIFGHMLIYSMFRLDRGIIRKLRIIPITGWLAMRFFMWLDRVDHQAEWPWMYMVVARKMVSPSEEAREGN